MNKDLGKKMGMCGLAMVLPLLVGLVLAFFIGVDWHLVVIAIYVLEIFFLIPEGGLFSSSLDYKAKSLNPGFQPKPERITAGTWELIRLLSVVAAFLLVLLQWTIVSLY